jgi:hypothetical protein
MPATSLPSIVSMYDIPALRAAFWLPLPLVFSMRLLLTKSNKRTNFFGQRQKAQNQLLAQGQVDRHKRGMPFEIVNIRLSRTGV